MGYYNWSYKVSVCFKIVCKVIREELKRILEREVYLRDWKGKFMEVIWKVGERNILRWKRG